MLIRQERQNFDSCDPDFGHKQDFVSKLLTDQCEYPEGHVNRTLFEPFGTDNVFLATSKAFNELLQPVDCYDISDETEAFRQSPYGFHFMRHGGDFEPSPGSDSLAGGQGSSDYSYKSMDEARGRGEVVEGSFPVYFDARWSENQANKFTTYVLIP